MGPPTYLHPSPLKSDKGMMVILFGCFRDLVGKLHGREPTIELKRAPQTWDSVHFHLLPLRYLGQELSHFPFGRLRCSRAACLARHDGEIKLFVTHLCILHAHNSRCEVPRIGTAIECAICTPSHCDGAT